MCADRNTFIQICNCVRRGCQSVTVARVRLSSKGSRASPHVASPHVPRRDCDSEEGIVVKSSPRDCQSVPRGTDAPFLVARLLRTLETQAYHSPSSCSPLNEPWQRHTHHLPRPLAAPIQSRTSLMVPSSWRSTKKKTPLLVLTLLPIRSSQRHNKPRRKRSKKAVLLQEKEALRGLSR